MATPAKHLGPRATGQQVYEDLHGKIVRGTFRPGDSLSETRVAESYGLSRTPVREVFWRLGEEGFLRVIPQVGTFVAPISVPLRVRFEIATDVLPSALVVSTSCWSV